jgi:hypothetical protein
MDVMKKEPVFEDGTHEITSINELVTDMKYEEHKVPAVGSDDRVSLNLGNFRTGNLF